MLISTVYLGSLENVWTVQVRHLLAPATPAGPLGKDASPIQLVQERTRGPKLPKLFPPPHILVLNYQTEHNAFAKESDLLKSMCMIFK